MKYPSIITEYAPVVLAVQVGSKSFLDLLPFLQVMYVQNAGHVRNGCAKTKNWYNEHIERGIQ